MTFEMGFKLDSAGPGTAGVSSFNSRTGAVVPVWGDYQGQGAALDVYTVPFSEDPVNPFAFPLGPNSPGLRIVNNSTWAITITDLTGPAPPLGARYIIEIAGSWNVTFSGEGLSGMNGEWLPGSRFAIISLGGGAFLLETKVEVLKARLGDGSVTIPLPPGKTLVDVRFDRRGDEDYPAGGTLMVDDALSPGELDVSTDATDVLTRNAAISYTVKDGPLSVPEPRRTPVFSSSEFPVYYFNEVMNINGSDQHLIDFVSFLVGEAEQAVLYPQNLHANFDYIALTAPNMEIIGATLVGTTIDGVTAPSGFTVTIYPSMSFDSISPTSESVGGEITLTGLNLAGVASVVCGGVTASIVSQSATEIVVTFPSSCTGVVNLFTPKGTLYVSSEDTLTITGGA